MQLTGGSPESGLIAGSSQSAALPRELDASLDIVEGKLVIFYRRRDGSIERRQIRDLEQLVILHRRLVRESGLQGGVRLGISRRLEAPAQAGGDLAVTILASNVMAHIERSTTATLANQKQIRESR